MHIAYIFGRLPCQGYISNFGFRVPFDREIRQISDQNRFVDWSKGTHPVKVPFRELKFRRRRQRERQKRNMFRLEKQQLCTSITLFCTFLCRVVARL